jgi:hypothetical protein
MAGSEIKVNQISPKQTCTTITVGNSGNTIIIPCGATFKTTGVNNLNSSTMVAQTNSTTITVGFSGATVSLASGATSSGFGATYNGAVNWSTTVRTSGFTAVAGNGYICNTTSAAFTVTLPSSATAGDILAFKDYAQTWATNNLTLNANGLKLEGTTNNSIQNTNGQSITLIYIDSTRGWIVVDDGSSTSLNQPSYIIATGGTITTCGNCKIHTFTSSGCFVVTQVGNNSGSKTVDYLVVAGGGGGGCRHAGGGGAGGFRQSYPNPAITGFPVTVTTYPITVGGGGTPANSGSNSVFSTITSAGGAGGSPSGPNTTNGGSGGGGGTGPSSGSSGNTPPVSPPQGNPGGGGGPSYNGGGGGGATGSGSNAIPGGGPGGNGTATSISGSSVTYAGGGGGGSFGGSGSPGPGGTGGSGGGGNGGYNGTAGAIAQNGTANRGGGGGGGGSNFSSPYEPGGSGGSGIVLIRYKYQ